MNTLGGIADLGATPGAINNVRYSSQAAGVAGHSYAVQLSGGKTGKITIASVRNPGALNAQAQALFRSQAVRMMRKLGSNSGPADPGDTAGTGGPRATMFLEVVVQAQ